MREGDARKGSMGSWRTGNKDLGQEREQRERKKDEEKNMRNQEPRNKR